MRNRLLANSATTPAKAFCRKVYPSKDPHEKAQCRSKQMRMQNFEVIHPQISSHLTNTISFEINWFIFFIDKVIVWVSEWVSHWVTLRNELTDVTLVSEDIYWGLSWCNFGDWWYHNMEMMIDRFISSQYIVKHFQSHLVFFPDLGSSMVITDLLPGAPFFFWLFSLFFSCSVGAFPIHS